MKIRVLIDNIAKDEFVGEWGLAVYIEYNDKKFLLDTGTTGIFTENAQKMGIDLAEIDYGVLSHAHYDHANGMPAFFEKNKKALFHLRSCCKENCYRQKKVFHKYIGIEKGLLKKYSNRIRYVDGDYEIMPGAYLIPHKTPGLEKIGVQARMKIKKTFRWETDKFDHEQSLVFETEKGLVIFNSCSHGGADNIIREVSETFPDKKICALIGGLHLFRLKDEDVLDMANRIRETGIKKVVTGHCTGDRAYEILKRELDDVVEQIHSGLYIEI